MADVLAAFDELERQEKLKRIATSSSAKRKGSHSSTTSRGRKTPTPAQRKTTKQPSPPKKRQQKLTPIPTRQSSPIGTSSRSPSIGADSRRISFADPPRPSARRLYIPTKSSSLASGFPYDPRLNKYGVTEAEWTDFSIDVVDAAEVPGGSWAWYLNRKKVVRRVKKELQYEGNFKRVLRRWNKHFKKKGFMAYLELPVQKGDPVRSQSVEPAGDSSEEELAKRAPEKRYPKRFRMVVSSNAEKGSSVYSRTSSLTRTVTGEAATMQKRLREQADKAQDEREAEAEKD